MISLAEVKPPDALVAVEEPKKELVRYDLACGKACAPGFKGVDIVPLDGVLVHDLRITPWPIDSDSVDEARCSHFFEHLEPIERVQFMNELHRILKKGAGCLFITPLGFDRQVQDLSHKWPPVVPASYLYFDQQWLKANGLDHYSVLHAINCDFEVRPLNATVAPEFVSRSDEFRAMAMQHYKNGAVDLTVLVVKR